MLQKIVEMMFFPTQTLKDLPFCVVTFHLDVQLESKFTSSQF